MVLEDLDHDHKECTIRGSMLKKKFNEHMFSTTSQCKYNRVKVLNVFRCHTDGCYVPSIPLPPLKRVLFSKPAISEFYLIYLEFSHNTNWRTKRTYMQNMLYAYIYSLHVSHMFNGSA